MCNFASFELTKEEVFYDKSEAHNKVIEKTHNHTDNQHNDESHCEIGGVFVEIHISTPFLVCCPVYL